MSIYSETNKKNLLLLIQLRWVAVGGQIITIAITHCFLGIELPLAPMGAVILCLIGLNGVSLHRYWYRRALRNGELFVELLLDVAALTIQLYLSGGATNPFVSLYLLQVILGAVLLDPWLAWALVLTTSLCFAWLTSSYREIGIPHTHRGTFLDLHIQGMFLCFILASTLLVLLITRVHKNLRARDARLAELRQRFAEEDHIVRMGLLATGAAHELGTPLATLSVILGDWRRLPSLMSNPEIAAEISDMQVELERCKSIVSAILLSAGEARGEGTVHTTIRSFFDDAAREWKARRSPSQFSYTNAICSDASIVSDTALKQVIFNLLDNALEASPGWLGLEVDRQGGNLVVRVSDIGPGFAKEVLHDFGRPYRSTKSARGRGLGLFLVVNVTRKLGGTLSVKNAEGRGAVVVLTLPFDALSPGEDHGD